MTDKEYRVKIRLRSVPRGYIKFLKRKFKDPEKGMKYVLSKMDNTRNITYSLDGIFDSDAHSGQSVR